MYLIRLDDASDHMNTERWERIERMLDENGVKPLVGVIPLNRDTRLLIYDEDPDFWAKARAWQAKGWRKADKSQVLNVDLWQQLVPLLKTHKVTFIWVKGHAGHPYNERCDKLATDFADSL